MANAKTETKATESKADAFKRLGAARVNKALGAIKGVEKMSNKATYDYTDAQVSQIASALDTAVQRVKDAFAGKKASDGGFTL